MSGCKRIAIRFVLMTGVAIAATAGVSIAHDMDGMMMGGAGADNAMAGRHMAEMGGPMASHMSYSAARPTNAADDQRARQIVESLRLILPRYGDYHVAERDGFVPFHPEFKQRMVHFTNYRNALKAMFTFDPAAFTSLLYEPLPEGGYKLVGVMYTAPRWAGEEQLNQRVPLSVTSWHRHVNLCLPPKGANPTRVDWKEFGPVEQSPRRRSATPPAAASGINSSAGWFTSIRWKVPSPKSGRISYRAAAIPVDPARSQNSTVRCRRSPLTSGG